MLAGLKALGVKVALDDVGSAYSSLGYLSSMPIDDIKLDCKVTALGSDADQGFYFAKPMPAPAINALIAHRPTRSRARDRLTRGRPRARLGARPARGSTPVGHGERSASL